MGGTLPTFAEPATFATPIDLREDLLSLAILFDLRGREDRPIEVQIRGQTLVVLGAAPEGGTRPFRSFTLPFEPDPRAVRVQVAPGLLAVNLMKIPRQPDRSPAPAELN